jgi:hypothetical protein
MLRGYGSLPWWRSWLRRREYFREEIATGDGDQIELWVKGGQCLILVAAAGRHFFPHVEFFYGDMVDYLRCGGFKNMGNKLLDKAKRKEIRNGSSVSPLGSTFSRQHPILAAFMSEALDSQDAPRELSRVTVFIDRDVLKASVSDPTNRQSVYVTLSDLDGMWRALEKALGADDIDWRNWSGGAAKKKVG